MSTGIRESERVTEQGVHEEWSDVELWEKLEQQKRRRTRWLILATTGVVLLLSALPPLFEHSRH
jgi:cell division septal protein FtsQ